MELDVVYQSVSEVLFVISRGKTERVVLDVQISQRLKEGCGTASAVRRNVVYRDGDD